MTLYKFSFPTSIWFGIGARSEVATHLKTQGLSRPLIVTDRGVAALPILAEFMKNLESSDLKATAFSEVWGNPVKSQVSAGVEAFKSSKADSIIGFGGGAALDVAKAIALMVEHPGDLFDYEDDLPGARSIDKNIPYWVALPTTSGTGSEVGRSAVVSDEKTHVKKIIFSPRLLARAVFADPELTYNLPPKVTASTGMDALTHCIEAYLAKGFHPICDGIALEGIRLVGKSLAAAFRDGSQPEPRANMMMASMMGAIAFQKGLGVTHSCAHALGTVSDLHHGLANGVMVDYALKFNAPTSEDRFKVMAQVLELNNPGSQSFLAWLKVLKSETKTPKNLLEVGVKRESLDELCRVAIADSCHQNNPRACTLETFKSIFTEAFQ